MYSYKGVDKNFEYKIGLISAKNEIEAAAKLKDEEGLLLVTYIKKTSSNKTKNSLSMKLKEKLLSIENEKKKKRIKLEKEKSKKVSNKGSNKKASSKNSSKPQKKKSELASFFNKKSPSDKPDSVSEIEAEIKRIFKENSLINEDVNYGDNTSDLNKIEFKKKKAKKNAGKSIDWDLIEQTNSKDKNFKKTSKMKIKNKEVLMFTRKLQIMISSGVSLMSALMTLRENSEKKLAVILDGILKDINKGNTLSSALAKYPKVFGSTYVSLVSIGETSGELDNCLKDIIKMREQEQKVLKKVKTASIYPFVIGIVLVVIMFAASFFFLPRFELMFTEQGINMPEFTVIVFAITSKVPIFAGILLVFAIIIAILKSKIPKVNQIYRSLKDKILLKMPLVKKVMTSLYFYYFTSTVSLMLKNGIRLSDTLLLASKSIDNIYIKSEISNIGELMIHGMSFSEAMKRQPHFEDVLINITNTGEESGQMVECLTKVSDYYNDELNTTVDQVMEAVPSLAIIVIGLIVAPIVIAAYLPILELSSGAGIDFG